MSRPRLQDARVGRIHERIRGAADQDAAAEERPVTGSRGGVTTVTTGGLLRKTCYFEAAEWRAIRQRAEDEMCTAAEIVRRAVRAYVEE